MNPAIFDAFEEICRRRGAGGHVLEVGAVPSDDALLCLPCLSGAVSRVGVNQEPACRHGDFEILQADANDLARFPDATFDTVLCNSTLEHDPFFWRALAEMRRVARPGALLVIGVPGYTRRTATPRLRRLAGRLPWVRSRLAPWRAGTETLGVHEMPGDYYRFSLQAVREVFFEGCADVEVNELLVPPRLVGAGRVR